MAETDDPAEMADDKTETVDDTDDTDDDSGDDIEKMKTALRKANREAAKYRKEHEALAKRLKDADDADKSEVEKLREQSAESDRRAVDAEMRALRAEVAHDKGLTAAQAKRLVGTTSEELEADADELLESFKPAEEPAKDRKPVTQLRSGATRTDDGDGKDPAEIADSILKRRSGI